MSYASLMGSKPPITFSQPSGLRHFPKPDYFHGGPYSGDNEIWKHSKGMTPQSVADWWHRHGYGQPHVSPGSGYPWGDYEPAVEQPTVKPTVKPTTVVHLPPVRPSVPAARKVPAPVKASDETVVPLTLPGTAYIARPHRRRFKPPVSISEEIYL